MAVTLSLFAGAGAQFFDNAGNVLTGGKIHSYFAGTTTPTATYTDAVGNTFHPNPIILDAAGRVPSGGEIWLSLGVGYKFVLENANNVLIATYDNIPSSAQPPAANDADSIMYEQGYTVNAGSFVVGKTYRILTVGSTNYTLIGSTSNIPGTHFIATGVGSGTGTAELSQTVETKLREYISVKDFGAVGDGVVDDTVAIENAINDSPNRGIFFPAGTYKITRELSITVNSYYIYGERPARGTFIGTSNYFATTINFDPTIPGSFIVNKFLATVAPDYVNLGPFVHENFLFNLNGNNGFQFGNESLPVNDGGGGQAFINNVAFTSCSFLTSGGSFASAVDGTMDLPGTRSIGLCKAFESTVTDVSIQGGDYGLRTFGCDKVGVMRTRFYCLRPFYFESAGSFTVQNTIYDSEIEGWAISPVINNGISLAIANSSFEANVGSPVGAGRYVLPTCTASVTANSGTLTFSRSMDDILIPYYSIIELTDGTNTDTCYVTAVSGTSVTVSTTGFRFTWSGTATTVTRIHNYGPLHIGPWQTSITNITLGSYPNTPWCVYVVSGGQMNVVNAGSTSTPTPPAVPIAIGNKNPGQSSMESQLILNNITAQYCPTTVSPFIRVVGNDEFYGNVNGLNNRTGKGDEFHAYNKAYRKWIYTPARYQSIENGSWEVVSKKVAGDTNTTQECWAWYLDGSLSGTVAGSRIIYFTDATLPSATAGGIKIVVRAKAETGTATMNVAQTSSGGGSTLASFTVTSTWALYTLPTALPTLWDAAYTQRGFFISSDANIYVESIMVIDENPNTPFTYVDNTVGKTLNHNAKTLTFGAAATNIFSATDGQLQSYRVKAYGSVNDPSLYYATVYAEYLVQVSNFGGTIDVRGTSLIYKQDQSIGAGVYTVDIVIAASAAAGVVTFTAAATKTGSGTATTGPFTFEIEAMGVGYSPITVI
jgi:hypothetical protein